MDESPDSALKKIFVEKDPFTYESLVELKA